MVLCCPLFIFLLIYEFFWALILLVHAGSLGSDVSSRMPPSTKAQTPHFSRTNSSPGFFDGSIDRPMRLAEIYVAAEHALRSTISDPNLWKSLSSVEEFEVIVEKDFPIFYMTTTLFLIMCTSFNGCLRNILIIIKLFIIEL